MSPMTSLPILPSDLIQEIISWLPVKPLVRFTCVSKHWKSLIFDPTFAKLHLQRSPKHTHTLLHLIEVDVINKTETWVVAPQSVHRLLENPSSTIVNEDKCHRYTNDDFYPIGSANGLVCLIGDKSIHGGNRELCCRFWNPSLRLRSENSPALYNIHSDVIVHLGFGYDDSGDKYKLVAVFWDHTVEKWEGRVHCMGDSCWRKTLACPDFPTLLRTLGGPYVNGSVNWLALNNLNCHEYGWENVTIEQVVIFSLDLQKETCKHMLLPDGLGEKPEYEPALAVLRGCMCLYYDHMKTHFVLWVMREFGVQESWTRLVNLSYVHLEWDFVPDIPLFPVCLSENGDVLILACSESCGEVIMYNQRDDKVEHIQVLDTQIWQADDHMKSLVLPRPHPH
ncbi:F-box/kelch-repeat protein At3g23880-like [Vicia villosa]|uniref:F-box/kelch-repeat protein At3g23880-like n=1 Tax=Vicia villosa TaxID=3911 RepID=UPI00273AD334|nr:F-box/kelch-repeat protein At3g23880-like [Vicia villosa]